MATLCYWQFSWVKVTSIPRYFLHFISSGAKSVGIRAQHGSRLNPMKAPRRVGIQQGSRVAVYLDSEE